MSKFPVKFQTKFYVLKIQIKIVDQYVAIALLVVHVYISILVDNFASTQLPTTHLRTI